MKNAPRIACVGTAGVSIVGVAPHLPANHRSVELSEISVQVGGHGAIAVTTAATLGCKARLCCKLADDFLGNFVLDVFGKLDIEIQGNVDSDKALSPLEFTTTTRDHKQRLRVHSKGDIGPLDLADVDIASLLSGVSALLLDGSSPRTHKAMAQKARTAQVPVITDIGSVEGDPGGLIAVSDVVICSERQASELAPHPELSSSLAQIQKLGPSAVIVTLGDKGCIGLHHDTLEQVPALSVEAIDCTHAGAVFHGAFAVALLSEHPFRRCLQIATIAASLSCRAQSPFAGIPTRREVEAALAGLD